VAPDLSVASSLVATMALLRSRARDEMIQFTVSAVKVSLLATTKSNMPQGAGADAHDGASESAPATIAVAATCSTPAVTAIPGSACAPASSQALLQLPAAVGDGAVGSAQCGASVMRVRGGGIDWWSRWQRPQPTPQPTQPTAVEQPAVALMAQAPPPSTATPPALQPVATMSSRIATGRVPHRLRLLDQHLFLSGLTRLLNWRVSRVGFLARRLGYPPFQRPTCPTGPRRLEPSARPTDWRWADSFIGDGGFELLVALRDLLMGSRHHRGCDRAVPPLWDAYPYPQQGCETGISADGVRASPPPWSDSILR